MPFISTLKKSFATAPIKDREAVVQKLATANTDDATYYQALIILQKIYDQVMQHDEPVKPRQATVTELELAKEMKNLLAKLPTWNEHFQELNTRYHLLIYPFDTTTSLEYIRKGLQLDVLDIKKPVENQEAAPQTSPTNKSTAPSVLDYELINGEELIKKSFKLLKESSFPAMDIEPAAYPYLTKDIWDTITEDEQAALMKHLLSLPTQKAFGVDLMHCYARLWKAQHDKEDSSWDLHTGPFYNLTLAQMDQLIEAIPEVVFLQDTFIEEYMSKLAPSQHVGSFWDDDNNELKEYLNRLQVFVDKLPPIYYQLKSTVKFHSLRIDIARHDYSEERFVSYLASSCNKSDAMSPVPSHPALFGSMSNVFSSSSNNNNVTNNQISENVNTSINIPRLGNSTISINDKNELVEEYLTGLIAQDKLKVSIESLGAYIDYHNYLKKLHAKIMLTTTATAATQWAQILGTEAYESLISESSVSFTAAMLNKSVKRKPTDTVSLQVKTKNIPHLSIRVFEIDTENYWRLHMHENDEQALNNKINLDGLCPTFEEDMDYSSEPALHVKTTVFEFGRGALAPKVFEGRGLWVVEFVGGQHQCRAIVQKGYLRHIMQETSAGHVIRVLDEEYQVLEKARIWYDNQYYETDGSKNILIPYLLHDKDAKMSKMILMDSSSDTAFCEPASFYQLAEKYKLEADFYVNPEMVYVSKNTTAVVIPRLSLNGIALPVSLLEQVSLTVDCTNSNEIKNSTTCRNIGSDPQNIRFEFMVPDQLTMLEFHLKAKIKTLGNNSLQPFDVNHTIRYDPAVNNSGIPVSVHLKQSPDGGYTLHAFGKNGEVKKNHEINLGIKHTFVNRKINVLLKTNVQGFIELGELGYVQYIDYSGPMGTYKQWEIFSYMHTLLPPAVCVPANTDFKISSPISLDYSWHSLYKNGNGVTMNITEDFSSNLEITPRCIHVKGLAQGKYTLYFTSAEGGLEQIQCTVIDNKVDFSKQDFWSQWVVGTDMCAKQDGKLLQKPLLLTSDGVSNETVRLHIENASPKAFVVVTLTTFVATRDETLSNWLLGQRFLTRPLPQENGIQSTRSIFLDDKRIGEEYQYILNRARSEQWVGSNLTKPSLLVYPKRKASTNSNSRYLEQEYTKKSKKKMASNVLDRINFSNIDGRYTNCCKLAVGGASAGLGRDASLGFLDHDSPILVLPVPYDKDFIDVDCNALGYGGGFLQMAAFSGEEVVSCRLALNKTEEMRCKDLRQKEESNKAFIRSKVVSKVSQSNPLELNTHEYAVLDSVEKLFDTIKTISSVGNVLASEFDFLKTWSTLSLEEKLKLHEKKVCHEFNLWLKKKDASFFDSYVQPALKSKIQKSFMDSYLVEDDLSLYRKDIYRYQQLSIVEKALLATTQSPEFLQTVLRAFKEEFDDKKVNDRSDIIFDSILAGSALALPETQMRSVNDMVSTISGSVPINRIASRMKSRAVPMSMMSFGSAPPPSAPSGSMYAAEEAYILASPGSPVVIAGEVESDEEDEEDAANALRERERNRQKKVTYKYSEATSEWIEHGAYNEDETVSLQKFWIDYLEYFAAKSQEDTFLSKNFLFSLNNITEVLYILSLMDLPFASETNWTATADSSSESKKCSITAMSAHSLLVFHRSLSETQEPFTSNNAHNLMLSQELFVMDESTPIDSEECIKINPANQNLEPFIEYGSHLIISNVSSKLLTCQVTVQVPTGAVPSQTTPYCISKTISIEAYETWHEVVSSFYFPAAGNFAIVPVTVSSSSGDQLLGKIDAINICVADRNQSGNEVEKSVTTTVSWSALVSNGSNANIVLFLDSYRKLDKLDFSLIGWRMVDRTFARQVFDVLTSRYFFSRDIWQYGVYHQFEDIVRDLLNFQKYSMLNQVGKVFESPLISTDSLSHQHELLVLDYYPLLNARAHPLKSTPEILNQQLYKQYDEYLSYLALKSSPLSNADLLILTLYLLLQDRIGEAHAAYARITDSDSNLHQVQKDYLGAYLKTRIPVTKDQEQMQLLDLQSIKEITNKYKDFGVLKWRQLFANLNDFVCEVEQGELAVSDNSAQNKRIQSEPILEFEVNERNQELIVQYANLKSIDIKYYEMNIEVMFSNNPFMNSGNRKSITPHENFTWVKPSHSVTMELPEKQLQQNDVNIENFDIIGVGQVNALQIIKIPFTGGNKNVFIEISNGTLKRRQAYYANSLYTHISESFGVVRVMSDKTKRPLAGVYVKVYARMKNGGSVEFWKDGYTGLNGVFDYIGVTEGNTLMGGSNVELKTIMEEKIDKLSILILSAEEGAVVKEAYPPLCN